MPPASLCNFHDKKAMRAREVGVFPLARGGFLGLRQGRLRHQIYINYPPFAECAPFLRQGEQGAQPQYHLINSPI